MPTNDSFRLDNNDRAQNIRPEPIQPVEQEPATIPNRQPSGSLAAHNIEPMPQNQVLGLDTGP